MDYEDFVTTITTEDYREHDRVVEILQNESRDEVLPFFLAGLQDARADVRKNAVNLLWIVGDDIACSIWETLLEDDDQDVVHNAMWGLNGLGAQSLPLFAKAITSAKPTTRTEAAYVLAYVADDSIVPAVLEALKHPINETRKYAVRILGNVGDSSVIPALEEALSDSSASVQGEAVMALVQHAMKEARDYSESTQSELGAPLARQKGSIVVPFLLDKLKSPEAPVRCGAITGIRWVGNSSLTGVLVECLSDKDIEVRRAAVEALTEIGDVSATPALIKSAHDGNYEVRDSSIYALGKIGETAAIFPVLVSLLEDTDPRIRWWAMAALKRCGDISIPIFVKALNDPDGDIRMVAVESLGYIGGESVFPSVAELVRDAVVLVRIKVVETLPKLGGKASIPVLVEALKDSNYQVRFMAAKTLGSLGDPSAIPALEEALQDSDSSVRHHAREALERVREITDDVVSDTVLNTA